MGAAVIGGIELSEDFYVTPEPFEITFNDNDNNEVGKLTIARGKLAFAGDAEQSAQIFFGCVVGANNMRLNQLKSLLEEGVAVTKDMSDDHVVDAWRRSVQDVLK